jgi:Fe-S-cluster-containing dehydrogenase component
MTVTRREALKVIGAAVGAAALPAPAAARERRSAAPTSVGMLYDSTLCIGCRACVVKCKEANQLPPDRREFQGGVYDAPADLNGTTKNVIKVAAVGEQRAFTKAQCMHCVDPACSSVCMIGALRKNHATGVVTYDKDGCVGCRYCQVACPFNIPKFEWGKALPVVEDPKIVKCELCRHRGDPKKEGPLAVANPACCEVCPRGAVIYGLRAELLAEAKRRLAAEPDRYEPKVYGEKDAGGTAVLYLSARGMPFTALGLPDLGEAPAPELSETVQHGIYYGMLAPAALFALALSRTFRAAGKAGEEEAP